MFSCSLSSSPSFSGRPLATIQTRLRRKRRSAYNKDMKDNTRGVKVFAKKREEKDKNYPNLYTPQDGELAERKAARTLKRLFTYVSIRVVQAHLEGQGNDGGFAPQVTGYDGKVQCPDYNDLRNAMEGIDLGDGDSWVREFGKVNPAVTLRILEARKAYCEEFDYEMLESFVDDDIVKANTELMTEIMNRSFEKEEEEEEEKA
ncbi:unnamed protein product [Bathycoccus prasinos]